ncbi:opacity protein-like surface antigen [Roseiarcus fermentans]|uniref:Opacity protein-like surface antigen n=2 Tax=Roseiarcus fermentans TaxID=1473586 RepID=A0A366FR17_9HYPH|nr:opacity protein-like surface antigen [Roseiarcus fermentans]
MSDEGTAIMANWTLAPNWRALVLAAALGLASGGAAIAVDLPPAPTLPPAAGGPEAGDEFSGWYLRGDVGAGFETPPSLASAAPAGIAAPGGLVSPFATSSFGHATLSPSASLDAGLGYVFNSWLRTDATLEYRFGGRFQSSFAIASPGPIAADRLSARVSSLVALINGYVDLGAWQGVRPFVGAGLGVADTALSGVSDQGFARTPAGAFVPIGGLFSNAARTHFAWALTAGFDVDIAPNLKLEVSYRYLNLGSIALGGTHCFPGAPACVAGVAATARGALASNDIRIGLVYLIGGLEPAAPLVARY